MLDLQNAYVGSPENAIHHLALPTATLLLYPSANGVVILNARSLALHRVLAFWEAFPETKGLRSSVSCISVDSGMKIIVAAMGSYVASWALSGIQEDTWRVHSTLKLPSDHIVTALHNKSGLLAVGTNHSLSVYTLILDNDLPTWSQKWIVSSSVASPLVRFAPSLMYIAASSSADNRVRIYATTTGSQVQSIQHPRRISNLYWRSSVTISSDDMILYTITSDSTLRIFFPVLDSPQHLQLHSSLDMYSALPSHMTLDLVPSSSQIFCLDREVISNAMQKISGTQDDSSTQRVREIIEGAWELFLRALPDGSVVITAVTNIDRRPPTLLNHFTLQHSSSVFSACPLSLYLLPLPEKSQLLLVTTSPLTSSVLSPVEFLDAFEGKASSKHSQSSEHVSRDVSSIKRFVRTPEGRGVGAVYEDAHVDILSISTSNRGLRHRGSCDDADFVAVLDGGKNFATYNKSTSMLTLHTEPKQTLELPRLTSLFTIPTQYQHETIIGITADQSVVQICVVDEQLSLVSVDALPSPSPPQKVVAVDPMAWGSGHAWTVHDVLLSVSTSGDITFWVPDESKHRHSSMDLETKEAAWVQTGSVKSSKDNIIKVRCSSAKKTALISQREKGVQELTIWDSKESEFASGLEYQTDLSEIVNDLDWTSTPDKQSILAVGYLHHVDLLCQQRRTYFNEEPGWTVCRRIEIGHLTSYNISDSIWLNGGFLLIGAGHHMLLYGPPDSEQGLFEHVAETNGPLSDYHPQMLLQCLLWDKLELVKSIIVNLAKDIERRESLNIVTWTTLPVESFLRSDQLEAPKSKLRYNMLFGAAPIEQSDEELTFSRRTVEGLISSLENVPLPHLSPNEQAHLLVLLQATLEIEEQQRALDSNGLRFLTSMKSFYILNQRASAPTSPASGNALPRSTGYRERLRYRDMVWAFHSESPDLLVDAAASACNGKMRWQDARAVGLPIWLRSIDSLKNQVEIIARNEFMGGEARDPTASSLFYFALGKVKLVHGLWRQAAWHKEQGAMLKFLGNDFNEPRWRTAALKNAFALLSKRRYEYAAAFFLLGGSLKDAVNVCLRQLQDFQLAITLARIVEQSNKGPVLFDILESTVLPSAFRKGNRWLGTWAFWMLNRRDLAVQILVMPLQTVAKAHGIEVDIGEPHYDDTSLALLFSQLRSKTLQTAKGTSEISGQMEFNFVLQIARVFCRMGCHALALDLVSSWSFERPSASVQISPRTRRQDNVSSGPKLKRRTSVLIDMDVSLPSPVRSRSPEPTEEEKPLVAVPEVPEESSQRDLEARKAGLGSLMKSAKQTVQVPEFDMGSFF